MNNLASLQRALQSHVIDGEMAIAEAIDNSAVIPSETRLRIYSDAYRLRLIEALEANFPVLAQALSEAPFAKLAQEYLAIYPSRHYSIRWFGHRLAGFLQEFPDYQDRRWLSELAEFEWKVATAFDSADVALLTADHLATIAAEQWPELRFPFHPSVQQVVLSTNVVAMIKALASSQSLPEADAMARTDWLIWRQDLTVQYRSLDSAEAAAVSAAMNGANFSELCEAIGEYIDPDQVPLRAVSLLKQWIADHCLATI